MQRLFDFQTLIATLILSLMLLFSSGCDTDPLAGGEQETGFIQAGLQQEVVHRFYPEAGGMYAATENGVWFTNSPALPVSEVTWQQEGLNDLNVVDLTRRSDGSLVAAVQRDDVQSEEPVLFVRTDSEADWEPIETDYGGDQNMTWITRLIAHPQDSNMLFARGAYSVLRSLNGGETWQPVMGEWDSAGFLSPLIEVDPGDPERLFAGGEASSFQPYLYRSGNRGDSWDNGLIDAGGDNSVYSMAFHPDDGDRLLIGMEGEIRESSDGGDSWDINQEIESGDYVVTMSPPEGIPSETVIASGSKDGTANNNLYLKITRDFGENWEKITATPTISDIYTSDLFVEETGGLFTIWMATSQGVWIWSEEM